jgi:hypothetical protein
MSPGVYKLRWFDCATGKELTQEGVRVAAGNQSWTKPSEIGDEIAVYIQRIG